MSGDPNKLESPRLWIYVVMIVGGMIWGTWFIYKTVHAG